MTSNIYRNIILGYTWHDPFGTHCIRHECSGNGLVTPGVTENAGTCIYASLFFKVDIECPVGWIRQYDSCYLFVTDEEMDWPDARDACSEKGAHLVQVDTQRESNYLRYELFKLGSAINDSVWTGGNELYKEDMYVWTGSYNSRIVYTDWGINEPNESGGDEDCISIMKALGYHWNDANCSQVINFICEMEDARVSPAGTIITQEPATNP